MNKILLQKHIEHFTKFLNKEISVAKKQHQERIESITYYQSWTKSKIISMSEENIYEYISKLWAMLIWGNKHYYIDKVIDDNGFENLKNQLAELVWGENPIELRWDNFRKKIKGIGPAMISEILCKTHPKEFLIWNRVAKVGLNQLEVENLPRYDYQLTGELYKSLCKVCIEIANELNKGGVQDPTLLDVDYFLFEELLDQDNLTQIDSKDKKTTVIDKNENEIEAVFKHNDIRDKLAEIGTWLGMKSGTEKPIAVGARVDTIWEATIGNMGRVIYVFEVQTNGSIDSLILNLIKAINNHSVQAVIAVSDSEQIEKIKREIAVGFPDLERKIKYWNYENVLKVHESLSFTNESINNLGLVPQGF